MSRADAAKGVRSAERDRNRRADARCRRESLDPDSHVFDRFGVVDAVARTFSLKFFSTAHSVVFGCS